MFGPFASLLLPVALGPLRPVYDFCADPRRSPWSHGRDYAYIEHVVPPGRTRADLMREAIRRVRQQRDDGGPPEETNGQFLARVRPAAGEDSFPLEPLPPGWVEKAPSATLVNSVHKTQCVGSYDILRAEQPLGASRHKNRAVSVLAVQQQLLGLVAPFAVAASGQFRIKFRPPERATHRFNPNGTSFQSVGIASDAAGTLTGAITTQLVGVALGLPGFEASRTVCYNKVFTIYLPFGINTRAFEAANRQLIKPREQTQCILAQPPLLEAKKVHLLIFPSGVIICVGATTTHQMMISMREFLPLLHKAQQPLYLTNGSLKRSRPLGTATGEQAPHKDKKARTV